MEVVWAAVLFTVSVPFIFLPPVLAGHLKKRHLDSSARWTSQQSLQMALGNGNGRLVIGELSRRQVFVVSVEPRDEEAGTPWGHSNVRHNFGYRRPLPLFSGVCWHLFKRKRRGGGSQQILVLTPMQDWFGEETKELCDFHIDFTPSLNSI